MVRQRTADVTRHEAGFSLVELSVVVAMIGILAILAGPQFMSYWRTSATTAAATELATVVNRARQLAISGNQLYCAEVTGTSIRYRSNTNATCTVGTIWTGTGTDANGVIQLSNSMQASGGPVVFTQLGAAALAGTFTVANPNGGTRNVVVAASGRVTVQ
jgi:prepilin-type N-terminal cleavage/methylation domain-containing protein